MAALSVSLEFQKYLFESMTMEELLFLVKHVLAVTRFDSPKASQKDTSSQCPMSCRFRVSILISPITITLSYLSKAEFKVVEGSLKNQCFGFRGPVNTLDNPFLFAYY